MCNDKLHDGSSWRLEAWSVAFLQTSHWSFKYCRLCVDKQTDTQRKKRQISSKGHVTGDIRAY